MHGCHGKVHSNASSIDWGASVGLGHIDFVLVGAVTCSLTSVYMRKRQAITKCLT